MEKAVMISVKGIQRYEGALPDAVELVTEGVMSWNGESCTLSYQESELTGLEDTLTTIQAEGDEVTLMRVGKYNSQMVFQEGRRHLSLYNTPYGAMTISVHTRHLMVDLTDRGGELEVDYSVEVDHSVAGRNVFRISVKELEGGSGDGTPHHIE